MTTRTLAVATVAVVVAAALIAKTHAYTVLGYKWGTLNVPFYVNPANKDVSQNAAISALQAGMAVWNTQSGTPFRYSYAGQVSSTTTGYDRKNIIIFRSTTHSGSIATTYWWYSNGNLVDADIVFWDGGWTFFTGQSGCSNGAYIEDVAAHELGHALGLRHTSVTDATMYGAYAKCSQTMRTLSSDDIAGAKKLYGSSGGGSTLDTAPIVTILSPLTGAKIAAGTAITFSGSAVDTPDGNLSSRLVWRSNIDGPIGTGASFSRTLNAGSHTITATVTDSTSHTASATSLLGVVTQALTGATLTATAGTTQEGIYYANLAWSGLTSSKIDIYRNGTRIATQDNDGLSRSTVPGKGTYTYKVCAAGTSTCTNQKSVTF